MPRFGWTLQANPKTSSNWMEIRIAKPYFDFFVGTYFYTFWRFFSSLKISQKWSEMYTNVIRLSLLGFLVLNFLISQKWIQMKMLQVSEKLKNIVTMNQLLKWLQTKVVLKLLFLYLAARCRNWVFSVLRFFTMGGRPPTQGVLRYKRFGPDPAHRSPAAHFHFLPS